MAEDKCRDCQSGSANYPQMTSEPSFLTKKNTTDPSEWLPRDRNPSFCSAQDQNPAWRPDQRWSFSIPCGYNPSAPNSSEAILDVNADKYSHQSNSNNFETASAPWDAGWQDRDSVFKDAPYNDKAEDVLYFSGRSFDKLDRIARALAKEARQPDFVIVGPFSYVDVLSDQEPTSSGFFMTATELEASISPEVLEEYFNDF